MFATVELPARWRDTPALWRAHHPHWNYTLWTDDSLRQLVATHYPWLLPTYDAYPYDTQRWDASRYALLHRCGGVYADLDLQPTRPIHQLIDGRPALLPRTPNIGLTNAFMASAPGHPFFLHVLQQLPRYAHAWYHLSKHNAVLSSTGSTFIWAMAMGWARDRGKSDQPAIVASADWGKCSICKPVPVRPRDGHTTAPSQRWTSPIQHVRGSSWHSADSTLVVTLYCHLDVLAVGALAAFIWWWRRSVRHVAAAVCGGIAVSQLNRSLEVSLAETLVFRPWIWLIMT
jgi:mannosyltransferase OCH1-like enzyme